MFEYIEVWYNLKRRHAYPQRESHGRTPGSTIRSASQIFVLEQGEIEKDLFINPGEDFTPGEDAARSASL